jgi:hypothetical protein
VQLSQLQVGQRSRGRSKIEVGSSKGDYCYSAMPLIQKLDMADLPRERYMWSWKYNAEAGDVRCVKILGEEVLRVVCGVVAQQGSDHAQPLLGRHGPVATRKHQPRIFSLGLLPEFSLADVH